MLIEIELDGVEPPRGQMRSAEVGPISFVGWLGLLRVLEQLTASAGSPPQGLGDEARWRPGNDRRP